jgi:hypothetical protein
VYGEDARVPPGVRVEGGTTPSKIESFILRGTLKIGSDFLIQGPQILKWFNI